jgi:hypothetical protein
MTPRWRGAASLRLFLCRLELLPFFKALLLLHCTSSEQSNVSGFALAQAFLGFAFSAAWVTTGTCSNSMKATAAAQTVHNRPIW